MFTNTPPSYNTFSAPPFTNTQSVLLPLRPVETRAGSERGHKPRRPRGNSTRHFIFLRTADGTLLFDGRTQLQLDRPLKKLHNRFLRDLLVDLGWSELSFASSSFAVGPVTRTPCPALAPPSSTNGKCKTQTTDDDQRVRAGRLTSCAHRYSAIPRRSNTCTPFRVLRSVRKLLFYRSGS